MSDYLSDLASMYSKLYYSNSFFENHIVLLDASVNIEYFSVGFGHFNSGSIYKL